MCDILIVYFRTNGENLNSSNKRCTTVYNSVQVKFSAHRPANRVLTLLSSMYNQGLGLRTRSRSLPQKEGSDFTPSVVFLGEPLQVTVRPMLSDRFPVCNQ